VIAFSCFGGGLGWGGKKTLNRYLDAASREGRRMLGEAFFLRPCARLSRELGAGKKCRSRPANDGLSDGSRQVQGSLEGGQVHQVERLRWSKNTDAKGKGDRRRHWSGPFPLCTGKRRTNKTVAGGRVLHGRIEQRKRSKGEGTPRDAHMGQKGLYSRGVNHRIAKQKSGGRLGGSSVFAAT